MSRLLLITSIAGFSLAAWSYFEIPTVSPASFAYMHQQLTRTAYTHLISDEAREYLIARNHEAMDARRQDERRADFSYYISFGGLLLVSALSLAAYRRAPRLQA